MLRTLFIASTASLLCMGTLKAQQPYARIKVHTAGLPGGLQHLGRLGLAVDHGENKQGHWFIGEFSSEELRILQDEGIPHEVLIPDLEHYYQQRNLTSSPRSEGARNGGCGSAPVPPPPAAFTLGSMAGFFTWQEMLDILDAMRAAYPGLISAKAPIGTSIEGRPIHFVRMSNAPDVDQEKPEVFYSALHHAREPASLSQLILFMWHLLENYGSDPEATYLLDHFELYFVPCINPDGYVYNETMSPEGGGMWRKNRRINGDGTFGVDLNRNYGQGWGFDNSGSSPQGSSDVYRGTSPFSEPETQAIRDFCEAREFRLTLNHHTFGNLLVYPWGYQPAFYTPDSAVFVNYGELLTRDNGYAFGTADQTVGYVVNGGSDDWMYGEQATKPKIFAMTPEAGEPSDGFWPEISRITDICLVNLTANLRLAHLAGSHAQATDRSPGVLASSSGFLPFEVLRLGQEPGDQTVSLTFLDDAGTTGAPITFSGMQLLEQHSDSVPYTLAPGLAEGAVVRLVLAVSNGTYTHRDTLLKVVGTPQILLADEASTLANWQGNWGISNTVWFSPSASITDSPSGNYANNTVRQTTVSQPVDLSGATTARLRFMARWDIEPGYDHLQVLASGDNGITWTALCGRYTKSGSEYQVPGEPVYDGVRTAWVEEEMSLDDFVGGNVRIRFRLVSDGFVNGDGFYFDDLRITVAGGESTGLTEASSHSDLLRLAPNPSSDHTLVHHARMSQSGVSLQVHNAQGALIRAVPVQRGTASTLLHTGDLAPGVYLCSLADEQGVRAHVRLVVARP